MSFNVQLLKDSFEAIKPVAKPVISYFYNHLFTAHPEAKPLFAKTKMDEQQNHLIASLVFIVDNVEKTSELVPYLQKMGARHVKYGTQSEHYSWVGASLIATFRHFFKHQWSPELEQTWVTAYGVIAEQMIKGAEAVMPKKESQSLQPKSAQPSSATSTNLDLNSLESKIAALVKAEFEKEFKPEMKAYIQKTIKELLEAQVRYQSEKLIESIRSAS